MSVTPEVPSSPEPTTPQETTPPSLISETTPPTEAETPETPEAPEASEWTPLTVEDIVIPEGVEIDAGLRDEFITIFNDREKSPQEQAQALVDLQLKAAQAASEANSAAWLNLQTEWQNAVKSDPEVGGDKLEATLGRIGRLVNEYGSPETTQAFDLTGAGNNPAIIKFLNTLATKLTEGAPASGAPSASQPTAAQKMFPSMKG